MKYNSSSHYNNSIEVQWYKFYSSKSTLWCKNTIAKTISPLVTSSKKPIVGCYAKFTEEYESPTIEIDRGGQIPQGPLRWLSVGQ